MKTLQKHKSSPRAPVWRKMVSIASMLISGSISVSVAAPAGMLNLNMMFSPELDPQTMQIMSQIRQNQAWAESAYGRSARQARPSAALAPFARGASSPAHVVAPVAAPNDGPPAVLTFPSDPAVSHQVRNATLAQWKQNNPAKEAALDAAYAQHDFTTRGFVAQ